MTVRQIADSYWAQLKRSEPYYAARAGEAPEAIEPVDEPAEQARAEAARNLLAQLDAVPSEDASADADLAAVLRHLLIADAQRADQMWHVHLIAPYQTHWAFRLIAENVVAPQPARERARLTDGFTERIRSLAGVLRGQRARGIILPRPAYAGARATWQGLHTELPALLASPAVEAATADVLAELDEAEAAAGHQVGVAAQPGGEEVYRAWVRRETTLPVEPEQLHRSGLEQCAELTERMAEIRARLGGPRDESGVRAWLRSQSHLYAKRPEDVAATYRKHLAHIEPSLQSLFRTLPRAHYDVRRLDPVAEGSMTFGYYQPPAPEEPQGLYRFNGSSLAERSLLTAAALILHELVPGHHLHLAGQAENPGLHPVQRHVSASPMAFAAFSEGWAEYASDLGWAAGVYDDDWDAYGRLAHERFVTQRLVVDTALNLGWWDLPQARTFMQENTLDSDVQIASETVRYATDLPAQALAYRAGYLGFRQAARSAAGADLRDIHEAMLGAGAVPLPHMQQRVGRLTAPGPAGTPGEDRT
ncbi:hypothetical protein GCM10022222_09270 [Amycolatopsis ultiminotia]|uniref:DUF885 domain-containing protein n=1 Tax=Amycolatopsis ultiminotia TaxID=543629 RepID=A0ABP6V6S1_9PSEU